MKGHAQRVKISQQKALCFKDQVGCKGVVAGDSANRSRRTRACRELATLVTGLSLPFAQWPVVSIPFLLPPHFPLHLISLFRCPAFYSPPLLLHLSAFPIHFLYQSLPNKSKDQPAICCQPSAPLFVSQAPFPTLCLSHLFRSQAFQDICFSVSAGDTQQDAFARRSLGTHRIVTIPLKADPSSDGASWGCSVMNDSFVHTGM